MARILIIDDDSLLPTALREALGTCGHTVREAADGSEALRWINAREIDLAILAIEMPQMDGLAVLRWFRQAQRHSGLATKIVGMSGGGYMTKAD